MSLARQRVQRPRRIGAGSAPVADHFQTVRTPMESLAATSRSVSSSLIGGGIDMTRAPCALLVRAACLCVLVHAFRTLMYFCTHFKLTRSRAWVCMTRQGGAW